MKSAERANVERQCARLRDADNSGGGGGGGFGVPDWLGRCAPEPRS
eukprot:SAG31_NODE_14752_length_789_cov_1.040580_2_plen_45_part_01